MSALRDLGGSKIIGSQQHLETTVLVVSKIALFRVIGKLIVLD
jgi:hypothetical protein